MHALHTRGPGRQLTPVCMSTASSVLHAQRTSRLCCHEPHQLAGGKRRQRAAAQAASVDERLAVGQQQEGQHSADQPSRQLGGCSLPASWVPLGAAAGAAAAQALGAVVQDELALPVV